MSSLREHLYLAALLHDIGKFYQRADTGSVTSSKNIKAVVRGLESILLPRSASGFYTHKHALWTAQFIEDYREVFQHLATGSLNDLTQKDNLINLAASHHLPIDQQTPLGSILKKADHLSSGMDRDNNEALKDDQDEASWDSFKKKRMIPIAQYVNRAQGREDKCYHLPIRPVELSKAFFPKADFGDEVPDYASLWERFKADFRLIQANTYHAFSETLLNLLFKYAVTIPSSTIHFPDVSLYDHLKTTAAIAICLYDFGQACPQSSAAPFLLIGADLSGIQGYIYQIVSQHASKNLKGRSFYLKLLSDSIARYLLQQLDLFQANLIYNSGGSFYMLAPNTPRTKEILSRAISYIESSLFKSHGTSLYVAIDAVEVTENALMHRSGENLQQVWKSLFEKREKRKEARFCSLISQHYDEFFTPFLYADGRKDSYTGETFGKEEKVTVEHENGNTIYLKELTKKQRELGHFLKKSDLLVIADEAIPYWKDKPSIRPADIGATYYLLNFDDIQKEKERLRSSADKVTVTTLNGRGLDCDFMRTIAGLNNIYALEFYGGNIYNDCTFETMCSNDHFSRLGILRMDVDNLGRIFQQGIAAERATLSRYAALSRSLDYFFSGYLNRIQQETAPQKSTIIYSGGDDLFIVGGWDITIALAKRIQTDFQEYTCHNPHFSLSGGIALVTGKYPLIKAAAYSEQEEQHAKSHAYKKQGTVYEKNSLSFFGTPLNWQTEFPLVESLKETLVSAIGQGLLPKSFLSKILQHAAGAQIQNHIIGHSKTYWMLTYDLSRMKSRYAKGANCNELIQNCINEVCGHKAMLNGKPIQTAYHALELWAFAARWAEIQFRTNK